MGSTGERAGTSAAAGSPDNGDRRFMALVGQIPRFTAEDERSAAKVIETGRQAASDLETVVDLTEDEEAHLQQLVAAGAEARERFIAANLRLAASIAFKYRNKGLPTSDLMQEATIGLASAVDKFNWRAGTKFSTYATYWIRQACSAALDNQSRSVRRPVEVEEVLRKMFAVRMTLSETLGREPTDSELADEMGMAVSRVRWLRALDLSEGSLDATVPGSEMTATVGDLVEDEHASGMFTDVDDRIDAESAHNKLASLYATRLTPEQATVMKIRTGHDGGLGKTVDETAKLLGKTPIQVRQLESDAMKVLRRAAASGAL